MINYIIILILLSVFLIIYKNYELKQDTNYSIRKYLVREDVKSNKPILWIYVPSVPNSRHPKKFGDGHSTSVNQDYLFLTMKSIIKNNDKSFKICIIDNKSFRKLLPNWKYDLNSIAPPISCNLLHLALANILYQYGGILVPISFLCFKDLIGMYDYGTRDNKMFICENINKSITCSSYEFTTDSTFMGCQSHNKTMREYIKFCEVVISTNRQNPEFSGVFNDWFKKKDVVIINGKRIGTKTKSYKKITIEDLFSERYLPLSKEAYGIYIPSEEIVKRSNYEWFARLSKKEVLSGNTTIQKHILLASSNESSGWVSFWKVPSGFGSFKPGSI